MPLFVIFRYNFIDLMITHSDRTTPDASNAVSNNIKEQSLNESHQLFKSPTDNSSLELAKGINISPPVEKSRSYQLMANNSLQVKQLKIIQKMADEKTVQKSNESPLSPTTLAKSDYIKNDQLNVVGEDHPESDAAERRDTERDIAQKHAKGEYWLEDEFKDSEGEHGDDPVFRFQQIWTYCLVRWKEIIDLFENNKIGQNSSNADFEKDVQDRIDDKFSEIKRMYNQILENHPKINEEQSRGIIIEEAFTLLINNADKKELNYEQITQANEEIQAFVHDNGILDESFEDVQLTRSSVMMEAANRSYETKGIWKVGQNHIEDINELTGEKKFNIVGLEEFNSEFFPIFRMYSDPGENDDGDGDTDNSQNITATNSTSSRYIDDRFPDQ